MFQRGHHPEWEVPFTKGGVIHIFWCYWLSHGDASLTPNQWRSQRSRFRKIQAGLDLSHRLFWLLRGVRVPEVPLVASLHTVSLFLISVSSLRQFCVCSSRSTRVQLSAAVVNGLFCRPLILVILWAFFVVLICSLLLPYVILFSFSLQGIVWRPY